MFNWRGDALARHNLPNRPVFDPWIGLAFLVGLLLAGWRVVRQRDRALAFVLIWSAVMLLPTLLATEAPHFLRAVGVLPLVMVFPALALEGLWTQVRWGRAMVVAGLTLSLLLTTRDYFARYLGNPATAYFFEAAAADLSLQTRAFLSERVDRQVYVDRRLWDSFPSIRFLLAERAQLQVFDSAPPLTTPGAAESRLLVWPYADPRAALSNLPEGVIVRAEAGPLHRGDAEAEPYSLFTTYTLTPAPAEWPAPLAVFEAGLILQSALITPTASGLRVELLWRTQPQPEVWPLNGPDYHVFVQWRAGEAILAQDDAAPARALYPTPWWPTGAAVWDTHWLELPLGESPTVSNLLIGMYPYPNLQRLSLLTGPGDVVALPVP
jgi:hypothetical protein